MNIYRICHTYDDQDPSISIKTARTDVEDLIAYIIFKASEVISEDISMSNVSVATIMCNLFPEEVSLTKSAITDIPLDHYQIWESHDEDLSIYNEYDNTLKEALIWSIYY